jgi:hypothetical protein
LIPTLPKKKKKKKKALSVNWHGTSFSQAAYLQFCPAGMVWLMRVGEAWSTPGCLLLASVCLSSAPG